MSFAGAAYNPFAAARFAPGALPWLGDDVEEMLARVCVPGSRHQILGPHGSGKSTLLRELERRARRAGFSVARVRGSRGLAGLERAELWLVDEYEELSRWERWWVAQRVRVRLPARLPARGGLPARGELPARAGRAALVVTAHRDVGFPTLCERAVSAEVARGLVERLLAGQGDFVAPSEAELARALGRHSGNLREVLFELYDQVERIAAGRRPAVDAGG